MHCRQRRAIVDFYLRPRSHLVAALPRLRNAVLNLDDNAPGLKLTLRFRPAES